MKRMMSLVAIVVLAAVARAEDAPPVAGTFRNVPHWNKDDVFHFDVDKTDTEKTGGTIQTAKLKYVAEYRIVEAGPDGYLMEWYMTDLKMIDPPDPTGQAARLAASFGKNSPVRFRLNTVGQPLGRIDNWEQVRTALLKTFDMTQESKSAAARQQARDSFVHSLDDPTVRPLLELSALEEPILPFTLQGTEFTSVPAKVAIKSALPGTTQEMPAVALHQLVRQDPSEVVLRQVVEMGPGAEKAVEALIQSLGGVPVETPKDIKLTASRSADATIDRKTGFVKTLKTKSMVEAGDSEREFTIEFQERKSVNASGPATVQSK